jgi:NTP pyrophosphatase (non-canonical NTP hydrolase)
MDFEFELVFKEAVLKWGEKAQILQCIEELSELTTALCKQFRRDNEDNILEEIADVLICISQLMILFKAERKIELIKLKKIARLVHKLETGEWIDYKTILSEEQAWKIIRNEMD